MTNVFAIDWRSRAKIISQIIASDFLSQNFKASQSFGEILSNFLQHILNESPFDPHSYYSKEDCHESIHGEGTCPEILSRDGACQGKYKYYGASGEK